MNKTKITEKYWGRRRIVPCVDIEEALNECCEELGFDTWAVLPNGDEVYNMIVKFYIEEEN